MCPHTLPNLLNDLIINIVHLQVPSSETFPPMRPHPQPPSVLTPIQHIAAQFEIPAYAVYRIACRLGIAPETQSSSHHVPQHTLHPLGSLFLNGEDAQLVVESIRLLRGGVHISTVFHLVESQRELVLGIQAKPTIVTLHQKAKDGHAWIPNPPQKMPNAFRQPKAVQAKWAMPVSIKAP
jgi:hypothetical protein